MTDTAGGASDAPLRVLWWLSELPPDPGGIGTFAASLAPHLATDPAVEPTYLVTRGEGRSECAGVPVTRVPLYDRLLAGRRTEGDGSALAVMRMRREVVALKTAVAPDVYHVHLSDPGPMLHVSTATTAPAPLVLTLHNRLLSLLDHHDDTLFGHLLDTAAAITTVSADAAADLRAHRPDLADRVVVIPNGVTVGTPPPPPATAPVIVAAGRLVPQKGFDTLIRALPAVRNQVPGVRVVIAGGGPEDDALAGLADDLGVADVVDLPGALPRDRVPALMESARVVAVPSRWEGLPYTVLEAAERGRAIVCTDAGGIGEVVEDGVSALVLGAAAAEHDPGLLAAALVRALTEPGLAESLGAAARERVATTFDIRTCAARYRKVYRSVVEG